MSIETGIRRLSAVPGACLRRCGGRRGSRPVVGPNLSQQAKLTASDAATKDFFGHAVAISSDGNFAIVGAWGRTKGTGAAFTFANSGGVWTQQAKLGPSDLVLGDQFGSAVAISSDGTTAVVGAESKNASPANNSHDVSGAVYVFTRSGSTWTQQAKLTASDSASGLRFGSAVSMSGDGNTLVVGARGNAYSAGRLPPARPMSHALGKHLDAAAEALGGDAATGDYFGTSAALSADGLTAVVGAPAKNSSTGASYVFHGLRRGLEPAGEADAGTPRQSMRSAPRSPSTATGPMPSGASGKDAYRGAGTSSSPAASGRSRRSCRPRMAWPVMPSARTSRCRRTAASQCWAHRQAEQRRFDL
jgi:hypothetical protein